MEKIALSAMKQSLKSYLTEIDDITSLNEIINIDDYDQKFIAHCMDPDKHLINVYKSCEKTLILIGPEGDFSAIEVDNAKAAGFKEVNLGPNRLRTETAGIVAIHTANLINVLVKK